MSCKRLLIRSDARYNCIRAQPLKITTYKHDMLTYLMIIAYFLSSRGDKRIIFSRCLLMFIIVTPSIALSYFNYNVKFTLISFLVSALLVIVVSLPMSKKFVSEFILSNIIWRVLSHRRYKDWQHE